MLENIEAPPKQLFQLSFLLDANGADMDVFGVILLTPLVVDHNKHQQCVSHRLGFAVTLKVAQVMWTSGAMHGTQRSKSRSLPPCNQSREEIP